MSTFTTKNGAVSTQNVIVTEIEREGKNTKTDKISFTYKRIGDDSNSTLKASKFTSNYTDTEKELIKTAKESGTPITITKVFSKKDGEEKGYWNLKDIKSYDATAQEKPKANTGYKSGGGYNEAGVKAGAVLHDAVAVAIAVNGKGTTAEHVATIARELLTLSTQLEEEVRSGQYNVGATNTNSNNSTTTSAVKTKTKETAKEEFDDLDDLLDDFNSSDL